MAEEVAEQDMSEFNAAIATLMRIDAIKKELITDVSKEDPLGRYKHISAFYLELVSILKDEEEKIQTPKFKQHQRYYRELKKLWHKKKNGVPLRLIEWLDDWEIELKNLEQKYGLNVPKKMDARFALARHRR